MRTDDGLLLILDGQPTNEVQADRLADANDEIAAAVENDALAIAARDQWEAAGSPLPCPLDRQNR